MHITFGNQYADEFKGEQPTVVPDEKPSIQHILEETFAGKLQPKDERRVKTIEKFTVNCFLRDRTPEEKNDILQKMISATHGLTMFDPKRYIPALHAVTTYTHGQPETAAIYLKPEDYISAYVVHEAIHWLQILDYIPNNAALTMTATYLLMNSSSETQKEIHSQLAEDVLYPFWLDINNKDKYYELVLTDRAHEAFKDGWILHPTDSEFHKDMILYLKHEESISRDYQDELVQTKLATPDGVINEPYFIIKNIGRARAERAYLIGLYSGNMDHAWTILYLHSKGKSFEEAEKEVVMAIMNNDTEKFYGYKEI